MHRRGPVSPRLYRGRELERFSRRGRGDASAGEVDHYLRQGQILVRDASAIINHGRVNITGRTGDADPCADRPDRARHRQPRLAKRGVGNITLFAFDAGQGLTEHTSPFEAFSIVLDGTFSLTVGGIAVEASTGHDRWRASIRMPWRR